MEIKIGDEINYKSRSNVSPEATYHGVVVGTYKNHFLARVKPIESTMASKPIFGLPRPYLMSINYNLNEGEKLKIISDDVIEEKVG